MNVNTANSTMTESSISDLTTASLIRLMQAKGFTHVLTFGGPVLLDHWQPYGASGEHGPGVNGRFDCPHCRQERIRWRLVGEDQAADGESCCETDLVDRLRFRSRTSPFVNGLWTFTKGGQ